MKSLFSGFGFLDLLHRSSLKRGLTGNLFLLYSISRFPEVSVIFAAKTSRVKVSSSSSIKITKICPYRMASYTFFTAPMKDSLTIITFVGFSLFYLLSRLTCF